MQISLVQEKCELKKSNHNHGKNALKGLETDLNFIRMFAFVSVEINSTSSQVSAQLRFYKI